MKNYYKVTTQESQNIFCSFIVKSNNEQLIKATYNNWVIINQIPQATVLNELVTAEKKGIPMIELEIIRKPL